MQSKEFVERSYRESIFKITLLFVVLNFAVATFLYISHVTSQKEDLFVAMSEKCRTVGNSVVNLYQKAEELGIPLNETVGGNEYLDENLKFAKEIEYLIVTDGAGDIISQSTEIEDKSKRSGGLTRLKGRFKLFSKTVKTVTEEISAFKIYSYNNIPLRIMNGDKLAGYLHVGVSNRAVDENIDSIFYDIALILITCIFIGYEFLSYIFRNSMIQPMLEFDRALERINKGDYTKIELPRTKDSFGCILTELNKNSIRLTLWFEAVRNKLKKINPLNGHYEVIKDSINEINFKFKFPDVKMQVEPVKPIISNLRLVMFLIVFGEAVLIPSIPGYAATFLHQDMIIQNSIILSALPIIIYMAIVCICIPFVPKLSYKIGFKKSFMIGAIITAVGYLTGFLFDHLIGLLISRLISAIGFSIGFVCSQNYVAAYAAKETRVESYTIINIAGGAAYLCGMPLGGILVDTISYQALFFLSMIGSVICFLVSKKYIVDLPTRTFTKSRISHESTLSLFRIKELVLAIFCSSLPIRLIFSGAILFLYPLYLHQLGNSQSMVGRIMMVYGIITFLVATSVPKYVKRVKNSAALTIIMSILVAIPMMLDPIFQSTEGIIVQISVNTICLMVFINAQMSIIDKISNQNYKNHTKSSILSFYYMFEYLGMILGPSIASILLINTDFTHTLFYLGTGIFVINLIYVAFLIHNSLSQDKNRRSH